ncbi:hypothetical protein MKZ26_03465 [Sporosarcina sp. FSL K6-6792]|uniref:hypothetical protein n=1 Tax=Sporosarcina sp. FSL K6-6792 TaxID=2921559 RepID=UPI0030F638C0
MKAKVKQAIFSLNDELDMFPETIMITVQRKDLETVVNHLHHSGEEWSNQSAFGYAIAAAESIGMSAEDIQRLVGAMASECDWKTLDRAADVYRKSDY